MLLWFGIYNCGCELAGVSQAGQLMKMMQEFTKQIYNEHSE